MRIARVTPEKLVLKESPWFMAIFLGCFSAALLHSLFERQASPLGSAAMHAMALVCAGVVIFAVRWVTVTFDRSSGRVEVQSVSLRGTDHRSLPLSQFIGAREDILAGEDSETSRLMLVFSKEMAAEIEPAERARLESLKAIGLRRAGAAEIPLTTYFTAGDDVRRTARAINEWAGR